MFRSIPHFISKFNSFKINNNLMRYVATVPEIYRGVKVPSEMLPKTFELAQGCLEESTRWDHSYQADLLLDFVCSVKKIENIDKLGNNASPPTFRLGVTGPPGAGKSTFVEAFGKLLTSKGFKVAVMCIDPSSIITGGSLLGDKTRMLELSNDPNAYVRPSPSNGELGGVAEHTADLILLTEAANYNFIIVETVGLGQSEVVVDDMVDFFLLVMPPTMGDSLQGVKKGIMEHADAIMINKCDGLLQASVEKAVDEHKKALSMCSTKSQFWTPKVLKCSSIKKTHLDEVYTCIDDFWKLGLKTGELIEKRNQQNEIAMWTQMKKFLKRKSHENELVQREAIQLNNEMIANKISRRKAAVILGDTFLKNKLI